jgi:tetratricopeptide (TPR) repeat protein
MMTLRMATRDAPDRAIHFFERALATDHDYAEAWAGLGAAYQIKGIFLGLPEMLEKALIAADEALTRDPRLADAHAVRGTAQFALGRLDDALLSLGQAIALDPKQARAHAQLARVHWVGRGDLRAGIAELERAVQINPQFGYAHHQLAYLYTELGEYAQAESAARKAVDLQEQYISGEEGFLVIGAHTRLGYVFYRQGRYEEALAEYQKELLFLSSSDHVLKDRSLVELHQKLGAALVRLGRQAEGRRHLQLAIRKYEERAALGEVEAATQYYVAGAYALLDDAEQAMRLLETSVRLQKWNQPRALHDPDFESLRPAIEAQERSGTARYAAQPESA